LAVVVDAEIDDAARGKALQGHPALDPATVEPFLRTFVDWIRTEGNQPTVGRFETLEINYLMSHFCDKGTGARLDHWPQQRPLTANFDTKTPNLTREQACDYVALALDGNSPSLAASLYADALHDYDLHRKVLMTAVAVETAVKEMLIRTARPDQVALINLLLNNPRDYSMSLISLFDAAAHAVRGRSLRSDNKELYKTIDALIMNRNRIVHKLFRDIDPVADLQRQIEAASEAMAWCDSISQSEICEDDMRGRSSVRLAVSNASPCRAELKVWSAVLMDQYRRLTLTGQLIRFARAVLGILDLDPTVLSDVPL
jgi:hypothetical protein